MLTDDDLALFKVLMQQLPETGSTDYWTVLGFEEPEARTLAAIARMRQNRD